MAVDIGIDDLETLECSLSRFVMVTNAGVVGILLLFCLKHLDFFVKNKSIG